MVDRNGVTDERTAEKINEDLKELGREVYKMADDARREVVQQLYNVADRVRSQAKNAEGEVIENADRIARNLEHTANRLNSRAVDQLEDATSTMRDNVWQTALIVFIVGVLIGLFLSRRD